MNGLPVNTFFCRGGRGGSSGRGVVENGGLRWPETTSEGNGLCGCDGAVLRCLRLGCFWDVWREVEVYSDGMVVLGGRSGRLSC